MKYIIAVILWMSLPTAFCLAGEVSENESKRDKIGYSIGYQIGGDLTRQGIEVRPGMLLRGIEDSLRGSDALLTPEQRDSILTALQGKIEEDKQKRAEKYRKEGQAFLAENAKEEGVFSLPSGLQYMVLQAGSGQNPGMGDTVMVNYRGIFIDGIEFENSYRKGKPAVFPISSSIKGWQEILPMMDVGAKWRLFIPPELAFGDQGPLGNQTVIFDLELLEIQAEGGSQGDVIDL